MAKTKAQNLTRLEESLSGSEITALDDLIPGLGRKLHKLISNLGNIQAAQAGHSGTVVLAEQKARDAKGEKPDAMKLQGGRVGDASPALRDDQYVTLGQVRGLLAEQDPEALLDQIPTQKPACRPIGFLGAHQINTGLTNQYGTEVLNEIVYVIGDNESAGRLKIYRIAPDNNFVLLSTLNLTSAPQRMVLQGNYIYACGGGITNLLLLNVSKPNAPEETTVFAMGFATRGLHVQGRYCYVVGDGAGKVVDVSVPGAPSIVGSF